MKNDIDKKCELIKEIIKKIFTLSTNDLLVILCAISDMDTRKTTTTKKIFQDSLKSRQNIISFL